MKTYMCSVEHGDAALESRVNGVYILCIRNKGVQVRDTRSEKRERGH